MFLSYIKINNFRLVKSLKLSFETQHNFFYGKNAQGKTTLLEAIRFLSIGRSFITKHNREIPSNGSDYFFLNGKIDRDYIKNDLKFSWNKKGKSIQLNDNAMRSLSNYIGKFNTVLFRPEDYDLVTGPPENKRKYLDIQISQLSPDYLNNLKSYYLALRNRNAILKSPRINSEELNSFTAELVKYGAKIIETRALIIPKIEKLADFYHDEISQNKEKLKIIYKTLTSTTPKSDIKRDIMDLLKNSSDKERKLGYTLIGPHRDDLDFLLNGQNAKKFASRGQLKSIAISLKFAESANIKNTLGTYPVLLIDDIFSELDKDRQAKAISFISNFQQVFIASTSHDFFKSWINKKKVSIYNVAHGVITKTRQ